MQALLLDPVFELFWQGSQWIVRVWIYSVRLWTLESTQCLVAVNFKFQLLIFQVHISRFMFRLTHSVCKYEPSFNISCSSFALRIWKHDTGGMQTESAIHLVRFYNYLIFLAQVICLFNPIWSIRPVWDILEFSSVPHIYSDKMLAPSKLRACPCWIWADCVILWEFHVQSVLL